MEFHTSLPHPPGANTLADIILYWTLGGHHEEAERLATLVTAVYRASLDVGKEGQCHCPCGCSHAFQVGDGQHERFGAIVCDSCYLSCSIIRVVFNVMDTSATARPEKGGAYGCD